jgi:pimeloyl-ACP methyl ester carboxylesterase
MKRRRWLNKILLGVPLFLILLLIAGSIYQWAGARQDRKTYVPVGELYDIGGRSMHLYEGGQGDQTVVLVSGWGTVNSYVDFYPLYEKLGPHVKFVVYDRFGYGYSDSTDQKRDIDSIVEEVHGLLEASGQKPPYVFAAHSLGSLETLRYAQKYPNEVKGIVFVDGGSPEYYSSRTPLTVVPYIQQFLVKTGVARALYHLNGFAASLENERNGLKQVPNDLKEMNRVSTLLRAGNGDMKDEIRLSRSNANIVLAGPKPLAIPITVLTADNFGKPDPAWDKYEAAFPSWSTNGKQIIVKDTAHYIHHYQPNLVVKEILALVE